MNIVRNNNTIPLTFAELREAAQEWSHLGLMQRIIEHLASYYDLPLVSSKTDEDDPKLAAFYNTYHLPFQSIIESAYGCELEDIANSPNQVFLFLSMLAQNYEHGEYPPSFSEEESFMLMFRERDGQASDLEVQSTPVGLGVFVQSCDTIIIGDPSVPKDNDGLCVLQNVDLGLWSSAVYEVALPNFPNEQRVALLLSKSQRCPYTFQQMVEQMFFWKKVPNGILTGNGAIGLFDTRYYQDPTSLGIPPVEAGCQRWIQHCIDVTLDYPYAGVLPHGIISSSGEGEGAYDAYYLRDSDGKVVGVVLDYMLYGEL